MIDYLSKKFHSNKYSSYGVRIDWISKIFYELTDRLPAWLFKFNKGVLFYSDCPLIKIRTNSLYFIEELKRNDILELSELTKFNTSQLQARFDDGGKGYVVKNLANDKIVAVQWVHLGNAYIKGLNWPLYFNQDEVYLHWAFSSPDIRLTGIFNSLLKEVSERYKKEGRNKFYGIVETWNETNYRYHLSNNFKPVKKTYYLKIFCLRLSYDKDMEKTTSKLRVTLSLPSDIKII